MSFIGIPRFLHTDSLYNKSYPFLTRSAAQISHTGPVFLSPQPNVIPYNPLDNMYITTIYKNNGISVTISGPKCEVNKAIYALNSRCGCKKYKKSTISDSSIGMSDTSVDTDDE
jgi:hypothetical protein